MLELILVLILSITSIILFTIGIGYLSKEEIKIYENTLKSYSPELKLKIVDDKDETSITNYGEKGYLGAISNDTKETHINISNIQNYLKQLPIYQKISKYKDKAEEAVKYAMDVVLRHEARHYTENTDNEVKVQYLAYKDALKKNKAGIYLAHQLMEQINPEVSSEVVQRAFRDKDKELLYALNMTEKELLKELDIPYKSKSVIEEEISEKRIEQEESGDDEFYLNNMNV